METARMAAAFVLGVMAEYPLIRFINKRRYAVPERTCLFLYLAAGSSCSLVGYLYSSIYLSVVYGITLTVLLTTAVVDIYYREIPAFFNWIIFCLGFVNLVANQNSVRTYVAGFLLSGLIFFGLAMAGGMGGGDVKLIASLGLLFGCFKIIRVIAIASVTGAFAGCVLMLAGRVKVKDAIPMAPFIYAAVVVAVIKL